MNETHNLSQKHRHIHRQRDCMQLCMQEQATAEDRHWLNRSLQVRCGAVQGSMTQGSSSEPHGSRISTPRSRFNSAPRCLVTFPQCLVRIANCSSNIRKHSILHTREIV